MQAAARSLVDFMESPGSQIVHLVHPKPTPWLKLAAALSSELSVPLVPYHEWLSKLEHIAILQDGNAPTAPDALAASRLLNFYRSIALKMNGMETPLEAFGFPRLSTECAIKISSTLVDLEELSDGDVKAWLAYWRGVGFI
jgi:hypothetical protein